MSFMWEHPEDWPTMRVFGHATLWGAPTADVMRALNQFETTDCRVMYAVKDNFVVLIRKFESDYGVGVCSDFTHTGSYLYFSDIPNAREHRFSQLDDAIDYALADLTAKGYADVLEYVCI